MSLNKRDLGPTLDVTDAPDFEELVNAADYFAGKCQYGQAAHYYEQALNFAPDNKEVLSSLLDCYFMDTTSSYEKFFAHARFLKNRFRKDPQFSPKILKMYKTIGDDYFAQDLLPQAECIYREAFDFVIKLRGESAPLFTALGNLYSKQGKKVLAIEVYQYALEDDPTYEEAKTGLFQLKGSNLRRSRDRAIPAGLLNTPGELSIPGGESILWDPREEEVQDEAEKMPFMQSYLALNSHPLDIELQRVFLCSWMDLDPLLRPSQYFFGGYRSEKEEIDDLRWN